MSADEVRVFTPGGSVAHQLAWGASPNDRSSAALCGRSAWPGDWHGTGTQDEEDRAAEMPLCSSCEQVITFRLGRV